MPPVREMTRQSWVLFVFEMLGSLQFFGWLFCCCFNGTGSKCILTRTEFGFSVLLLFVFVRLFVQVLELDLKAQDRA